MSHTPRLPVGCPPSYSASGKLAPLSKVGSDGCSSVKATFPGSPAQTSCSFLETVERFPQMHLPRTALCYTQSHVWLSPLQNHKASREQRAASLPVTCVFPTQPAQNRQQCVLKGSHLLSLLPASFCLCSTATGSSIPLLCA